MVLQRPESRQSIEIMSKTKAQFTGIFLVRVDQ